MPRNPTVLRASALLVIDVQDSFKALPRWERRSNPAFEANLALLIEGYRRAGLPVYFILHSDTDTAFHTTSPHYKLMDFLEPRPDELLLHKITRNCFTSTPLQRLLALQGVRHLAISGIQTEQCCETTARLAADLGFQVDFVLDATRTFPIQHQVGGRVVAELGVAEIEERTCFVLRDRFARIVETQQLVRELGTL